MCFYWNNFVECLRFIFRIRMMNRERSCMNGMTWRMNNMRWNWMDHMTRNTMIFFENNRWWWRVIIFWTWMLWMVDNRMGN